MSRLAIVWMLWLLEPHPGAISAAVSPTKPLVFEPRCTSNLCTRRRRSLSRAEKYQQMVSRLPDNVVVSNGKDGLKKGTTVGFFGIPNLKDIAKGREASQPLSQAELQHFAMDAIKDAGSHSRLSKIMAKQFVPLTLMPTPRPTPPTQRPTPRPSPAPTPTSGAPTVTIAPRTHMPKGISAARAKQICTRRKDINWGEWGACSTSCGKRVGVQYRAMQPLSAAKLPTWCPYHEVRTCNSDIPCSSMPSLRPPAPTPPSTASSTTLTTTGTPTNHDGELGAPAGDGDPTQCRNPGRCVGVGKTGYCAGHQQAGFGNWQLLHTRAGSDEVDGVPLLMSYVDTRACGFENTPVYLHSLAVDDTSGSKVADQDSSDSQGPGREPGWDLLMTTAIHTANRTGFHLFAVPSFAFRRVGDPPTYDAQHVLQRARQRWGIAWVGVTGSEAGATRIGMTGWRATAAKDVLYADVNTTAAKFIGPHAPRYFVSMHRASTTLPDSCGTHSVFSATPNGFRVYMFQPPGHALTARQAEQQRWAIMWFGIGQRVDSLAGEDAGAMLGNGALSLHNAGVSSPKAWEQHSPGENPKFIQTRVDASDRQFLHPIFITSLDRGSDHYPFMTAGAACTFFRVKKGESEQDADASAATGFDMYVDTANAPPHFTAGYSSQFGWRVNYLGIEINRDCVIGAWGDWTTTCSKTCGSGRFIRRRAAIVSAIGAGKACPALSQSRPCNTQVCITASPTPAPTPKRVDCVMTQWGDWQKCSRSCGGGHRRRDRQVKVSAEGGGQPCGEVKQTESCDTHLCHPHTPGQRIVTCGGGGSGASHMTHSGVHGITHTTDATTWRSFGADGIYVDVDTTLCLFEDEPQYVTAVVGDAAHWALQGTNTVASASRGHFRVIVIHPYLRSMALLGAARIFKWRLSWVAIAGRATGATKSGETGWRTAADVQTLGPGLYTEVSTRAAGFQAGIWNGGTDSQVMPRYFTALRGLRGHWRLTGSHVLFYPSMTSFRVYVQYQHRAISAKEAESKGWVISWFGDVDGAASGSSRAKWQLMGALDAPSARGGTLGCHTRVDLRDHHFTAARPPSYVASITAIAAAQGDYVPPTLVHQQLWNVSGGTAIFSSDVSGFSVLLNFDMRAPPPHFSGCSSQNSWRVNWFAYLPHRDCVMTPWAAWGACACTGIARGIERRFRTIAQFPSGGGTPCPKQHAQRRHCDISKIRCPTPAPTPVHPTPPPTSSPTPLPPLGLSMTHVVRLTGKLQLRLCATCQFGNTAQQTFRSVLAGMLGISTIDVRVHPTDFLPTDDGLAVIMSYKIDLSDKISAFEARANMHTTTFVGSFGHRLKVALHAKGDGYNTATLVSPMQVVDATIKRITHAPTPKAKPLLQTQQQEGNDMAPILPILGPTSHTASDGNHGRSSAWWIGVGCVLVGSLCVILRIFRHDAAHATPSGGAPTAGAIALQASQKSNNIDELAADAITELRHTAGGGEYGYGAVDPDDGFTAALPQPTGNDISIAFVGDADTEV